MRARRVRTRGDGFGDDDDEDDAGDARDDDDDDARDDDDECSRPVAAPRADFF